MKHAGPDALNALEPLLAKIRAHTQLKEKKRGLFYRKGKSFLHFHEDASGPFADVSEAPNSWRRLRVTELAEQKVLLARITQMLNE